MSKTLKKHCTINNFIKDNFPKFFELLEDTCMESKLRPMRGHNGVTFIIPGKDTMKELEKYHYSSDIEKCIDIIAMHIVRDYLPNAAAWKGRPAVTDLGFKIAVKEVKANTVILADGAELEIEEKFKPFERRANNVVWRVKKGDIDPKKHTERGQPQMAGGKVTIPTSLSEVNVNADQLAHSLIQGGGVAEGPFSYLTGLINYALEQKHSCLPYLYFTMHKNLVISTSVFVNYSQVFVPIRQEFENTEMKKYSMSDYHDAVERLSNHFQKGVSGGATRQEVHEAITRVISAVKAEHESMLRPWCEANGCECSDELVAFVSNINLARYIECKYFDEIAMAALTTGKPEVVREEFRNLFDILRDQAVGTAVTSNAEVGQLGALVLSLLKEVDEFKKSHWCCYPQRRAEADAETVDYGKLFRDTNVDLLQALKDLTPEELSRLFAQLNAQS